MPADDGAELFAVVDPDTGAPTGALIPRALAHATGAWHRAVHVWVWAAEEEPGDGPRLLLQRRAAGKGVCPGAWDVSVAEHLRPGETCQSAAVRGLAEELGVDASAAAPHLTLTGPSPPGHRHSILDAPPVLDREVVETWHLHGWRGVGGEEGGLAPDPAEVGGVRWVTVGELQREVGRLREGGGGGGGGTFTPWCLEQGRWQGWW